jgi:hypothetical protein
LLVLTFLQLLASSVSTAGAWWCPSYIGLT